MQRYVSYGLDSDRDHPTQDGRAPRSGPAILDPPGRCWPTMAPSRALTVEAVVTRPVAKATIDPGWRGGPAPRPGRMTSS
jgi:hypothetical protein